MTDIEKFLATQIDKAVKNPVLIPTIVHRIKRKIDKQTKIVTSSSLVSKSHNVKECVDMFHQWVSEITGFTVDQLESRSQGDTHELRFSRNFIKAMTIDTFGIRPTDMPLYFKTSSRYSYYDVRSRITDAILMPKVFKTRYHLIKEFNQRWDAYCKAQA